MASRPAAAFVLAGLTLILSLSLPSRPLHGQPTPAPSTAAGRKPVHVAVILDSSGSMKQSDPRRLSVLAAQIVTDLSGPDDRLALLTMGRAGRDYVLAPMGPVQGRRERIQQDLQRLRFDGATDCEGPLREAARLLRRAGEAGQAEQFVVFLSDGICPSGEESGEGSAGAARKLRAAAEALAGDEVRIFTIGMFGEAALEERADPSADLRAMANLSGGEYFRAEEAADLPLRFSEILGRIVGSEAIAVKRGAGGQARVELDGYVWDASLVVTGSAPVVVDAIAGPDGAPLPLPDARRPPFAARRGSVWAAADANGYGQHYATVRIASPAAGPWTFTIDGPPDAHALLIQNYALDPVLERVPDRPVYRVGEAFEARVWLRGREGERLEDPAFLERLDVTLALRGPDGEGPEGAEQAITTSAAADGFFSATVEPTHAGAHELHARVAMRGGGLDKTTAPQPFRAFQIALTLADDQAAIDLGRLKAGEASGAQRLDLSTTEVLLDTPLAASLEGLDDLTVTPSSPMLGADDDAVELGFTASPDHPGGPITGTLLLSAGASTLRVPVRAEIVPVTFWERWGALLSAIGIGLLGLIALIVLVLGYVRSHPFPPGARLNWGESLERLEKNTVVIADRNEARGRFFFRNASMRIGGPAGFLHDGLHRATLVATGPGQITLVVEPGVEAHKLRRFGAGEELVEERRIPLHNAQIYRVGEIYLRIQ